MITLTEKAANKIQNTIRKRGYGEGIRIGIKTTGCSGLAYILEYVDTPNADDICIEQNNCKIFVDQKSFVYVNGMQVDYVRNGLNEGFEFKNPNERDRCGCGESFRV
jgi:iron-sulfur cluster assembly protein